MRHRHPSLPGSIPKRWLMTDERMGDALWPALAALPQGSGIVFRHYGTPRAERRRLLVRIHRIARRRRLVLLVAGEQAVRGADGRHNRRGSVGLRSRSVHRRAELVAAARDRVDLVFVSPVFATRSHPRTRGLGPLRAAAMIRGSRLPAIALGGMDERRWRRLHGLGFHGWAAIDAWLTGQKRKAVPI